jgi:hypothetical protein
MLKSLPQKGFKNFQAYYPTTLIIVIFKQGGSVQHSSFWIGLYGQLWIGAMEFLSDLVDDLMRLKSAKIPYFSKRLTRYEADSVYLVAYLSPLQVNRCLSRSPVKIFSGITVRLLAEVELDLFCNFAVQGYLVIRQSLWATKKHSSHQ